MNDVAVPTTHPPTVSSGVETGGHSAHAMDRAPTELVSEVLSTEFLHPSAASPVAPSLTAAPKQEAVFAPTRTGENSVEPVTEKRQIDATVGDRLTEVKRAREQVPTTDNTAASPANHHSNSSVNCAPEDRQCHMCAQSLELLRSWWCEPHAPEFFHELYGNCLETCPLALHTRYHIAATFRLSELFALQDGEQLRSRVNYFTTDSGLEFKARVRVERSDFVTPVLEGRFVFTVEAQAKCRISRLSVQMTKITAAGGNQVSTTDQRHSPREGVGITEDYIRSFVYKKDKELKVLLGFSMLK